MESQSEGTNGIKQMRSSKEERDGDAAIAMQWQRKTSHWLGKCKVVFLPQNEVQQEDANAAGQFVQLSSCPLGPVHAVVNLSSPGTVEYINSKVVGLLYYTTVRTTLYMQSCTCTRTRTCT